ncbi:MAG: saccharopine dehydrogenase C-terminal domain-containing protein [Acidimicrobiia bacterium]
MNRIVVLGCGAVGRHMAIDLCKAPDCEVVSVDVDQEALERLAREHPIQTRVEDLSTAEGVTRAVEDADLVIGSVPYSIGYAMLEGVIRAGKNVVDISYFPEDPFGLDDLAKGKSVTAVVDCGVAPGLASIILGDHTRKMKVTRYECYVGGIPRARNAPFEYKSPFPVLEVLEEYAGSAKMVEDGKVVVRPMLSETATIEVEQVGSLACLNSDGLRTLIRTMEIPDMLEKTLRYPGHADAMRIFRDAGFLNLTPIQVKGASVRPIDVTASLLSPQWRYGQDEADLTVMRLVISGEEDGKPATYTYDLYDEYDPTTGTLSMARTTGYTCTAVGRLVLDGDYSQKGICPPEFVGRADGCWERVEEYLEDRGVRCRMQRS